MATGIAGNALQFARTIMGGVLNAAQNMFALLGRLIVAGLGAALRAVQTAIGTLFQGLLRVGQGMLTGAVHAIGASVAGLAAIAGRATAALSATGGAINSLRGATGLGAGASGSIVNNFSAFGFRPEQTSAMFEDQNPLRMRIMAGVWRLPSQDNPNFIPALASRYQNTDPIMRRSMLQSMGLDNDQMRHTLVQPVGALQQQSRFQQQVQGSLGVNPEVISRSAQMLEMVTNQFRVLGTTVLVRIASEVLPRVLNAFTVLSNYLAGRGGEIGNAISSAVDLVFNTIIRLGEGFLSLPVMFRTAGNSVLDFAEVVVSALPAVWDIFLQGISVIQNALGSLTNIALPAFEQLPNLIQVFWDGMLHLVDFAQTGWERIGGSVNAVLEGIGNGLDAIANSDIFKRLVRALPVAQAVMGARRGVANAVDNAGRRIGLPDAVSAAAGAAAAWYTPRALWSAGRWALGRAFGTGAAGGAADAAGAATTAGTLARAGLLVRTGMPFYAGGAGPVAAVTAGGIGLGYGANVGLYHTGQSLGLINPDQPFTDALQTGIGRAWAGLRTGHTSNYDKWLSEAASQASTSQALTSQSPTSQTPAMDIIHRITGRAHDAWNAPHGTWAQDINALPQTLLSAGRNVLNTPRSPWAQALDDRFGGTVQKVRDGGLDAIQTARDRLNEYDPNTGVLREMLNALKEGNALTQAQSNQLGAAIQGGDTSVATDRTAAFMLLRYAKESGAALRRQ